MKSLTQNLYDSIWISALEVHSRVYDYAPTTAQYPFLVIDPVFHDDLMTKSHVLENHSLISIHAWGSIKRKKELSDLVENLRQQLYKTHDIRMFNQRTLIDQSTNDTLLHTIMDLEIKEK